VQACCGVEASSLTHTDTGVKTMTDAWHKSQAPITKAKCRLIARIPASLARV
jgi:hypothetical protein